MTIQCLTQNQFSQNAADYSLPPSDEKYHGHIGNIGTLKSSNIVPGWYMHGRPVGSSQCCWQKPKRKSRQVWNSASARTFHCDISVKNSSFSWVCIHNISWGVIFIGWLYIALHVNEVTRAQGPPGWWQPLKKHHAVSSLKRAMKILSTREKNVFESARNCFWQPINSRIK